MNFKGSIHFETFILLRPEVRSPQPSLITLVGTLPTIDCSIRLTPPDKLHSFYYLPLDTAIAPARNVSQGHRKARKVAHGLSQTV